MAFLQPFRVPIELNFDSPLWTVFSLDLAPRLAGLFFARPMWCSDVTTRQNAQAIFELMWRAEWRVALVRRRELILLPFLSVKPKLRPRPSRGGLVQGQDLRGLGPVAGGFDVLFGFPDVGPLSGLLLCGELWAKVGDGMRG